MLIKKCALQYHCCCFFFLIEKDNIVQLNLKSTLLEASKGKKVGSTADTCGWARNPRMESTKSKIRISRNRKKTSSHTPVATRKSNILLQASEG